MKQPHSLLAERKIELELTDAAKYHLVETGFNPTFGARPLKRALQRKLQDPPAMALLSGKFGEDDHVRVDFKEKTVVFENVPAVEITPIH